MPQNGFNLQINTLTDKANFVLHGVVYGVACVGIGYYVGSPIITTSAVVGSVLINSLRLNREFNNTVDGWVREIFPATYTMDLPNGSKQLPEIIEHLSKALGMRSPPPLYAFGEETIGLFSKVLKEALGGALGRTAKDFEPKLNNALEKNLRGVSDKDAKDFKNELKEALKNALGEVSYKDEDFNPKPKTALREVLDELAEGFKARFKKNPGEVLGELANAGVYGTEHHGLLIISRTLMNVLNLKEQTAILAHQMGHIAANHKQKTKVLQAIGSIATFNAALNMAATLFSSWAGFDALVASWCASDITKSVLVKDFGFDPKDKKDEARIKKISRLVSTGTLLGFAYLEGKPEILAAWVAEKVTTTAVKLVDAHYSRCNVFQADRIAAGVTGDPLSVISGLRKAQDYNIQIKPEIAKSDYTKGPLILRPYRRAKAIFWPYPHSNRRAARLMKMARSFEGVQETAHPT